MITTVTGRHMEVTGAMRSYVEKKIARLGKHHNRISDIEVVIDEEGKGQKIEIIVKVDNHQRFVVNHSEQDAYACVDAAIDKIERQLTQYKEKTRSHKGKTGAAEATIDFMESKAAAEE